MKIMKWGSFEIELGIARFSFRQRIFRKPNKTERNPPKHTLPKCFFLNLVIVSLKCWPDKKYEPQAAPLMMKLETYIMIK